MDRVEDGGKAGVWIKGNGGKVSGARMVGRRAWMVEGGCGDGEEGGKANGTYPGVSGLGSHAGAP